MFHTLKRDGVVKTLHPLRHYKFAVVATYLSTPHSIKFAPQGHFLRGTFLEYEVFYLAILVLGFYEFINCLQYGEGKGVGL